MYVQHLVYVCFLSCKAALLGGILRELLRIHAVVKQTVCILFISLSELTPSNHPRTVQFLPLWQGLIPFSLSHWYLPCTLRLLIIYQRTVSYRCALLFSSRCNFCCRAHRRWTLWSTHWSVSYHVVLTITVNEYAWQHSSFSRCLGNIVSSAYVPWEHTALMRVRFHPFRFMKASFWEGLEYVRLMAAIRFPLLRFPYPPPSLAVSPTPPSPCPPYPFHGEDEVAKSKVL